MRGCMWVLSLALSYSTQVLAADAPPSTTVGLTATMYSNTVGEVRWSRSTDDSGVVIGYEITRDGVVLGVFDALSFVETDLSPATEYVYGVTAIDNAGQRSETSTVMLSTVFAPTGLTSAVYSTTAAEIFWNRSSTRGLQYEVRRDGMMLGVTDGVSWFDDGLASAMSYVYEVITFDATGRRSAPVVVSVTALGNGSEDVPGSPENMSAAVYSATAAEIFWERSLTAGLLYEVLLDGVLLDTVSGTSWFDDALTGGTSYEFQVVAIDSFDRRSHPSNISLTTNSDENGIDPPLTDNPFTEANPNAETTVAQLGYPVVRDLIDDLVSMSYLDLYYDNEPGILSVLSEGAYNENVVLNCPQGGTASGLKSRPGSFTGNFDACALDGVILTGDFERIVDFTVFGAGSYQVYTASFDELTIDAGDDGLLLITGTSERYNGTAAVPVCGGAPKVTTRIRNEISSARWETAEGVTAIASANWMQAEVSTPTLIGEPYVSACSSTGTLSFDGNVTLVSETIGEHTAVLVKQGEKVSQVSEEGVTTTDAHLEADFGDGSTLTVTSISAREARVNIMAEGVSVSFIDDFSFAPRSVSY